MDRVRDEHARRFGHVVRAHTPRLHNEEISMATSTKTTKRKVAVTQMNMALTSSSSFDDLVAALKITLTVPELPGFRGCRPCLSGLDRIVIEDLAMRGMR
jgi:hypothetical protein